MVDSTPPANQRVRGEVVVVGVGARTCIGQNALQTTMGIRAEALRPIETRFVDSKGELVGMCCVNCIDPALTGAARLIQLARPALLEATANWMRLENAKRGVAPPLPLVVAIPEGIVEDSAFRKSNRIAIPEGAGEYSPFIRTNRFIQALDFAAPGLVNLSRSQEVIGGRAAGVEALSRALEMLADGAEAVLVGGVDSYYDPDRLEALERDYRLHGLDTENGLIPGEAAAFCLVTQRRRASASTRYASILGCGIELEPRPYGADEPCHALGITAALRKATHAVSARRRIGWQITDVVDERHRVDEWQLAAGRTFELYTHDVLHEQPLLTVGDVGAASAALFTVEASVRWQTGCGLADLAVIALHSDGPERAAVLCAAEAP